LSVLTPPLLNADGDIVPLGAAADVRESAAPVQITGYNTFPAAPVTGVSEARREHRERQISKNPLTCRMVSLHSTQERNMKMPPP
jgi:multidrug efflux pump subunit AcrB